MLFSLSIFIWKKRTYYYPDCIYKFLIFLFNVFLIVDRAEGGECCRAHYDANGFRHETMWCSHYCCQDRVRTHSPLYCCSDFFMRAERSDRLDFCSSWFSASSNLQVTRLQGRIRKIFLVNDCFNESTQHRPLLNVTKYCLLLFGS